MITYLVDGKLVDANGNPATKASSKPFTDFPESVQKSLNAEDITTVAKAKALGKEGLMKLEHVGEKTAEQILAL